MHDQKPGIVLQDPWLEPFAGVIANRMKKSVDKLSELTSGTRILKDFATGHLYFGIHRKEDRWVIREWAPNATAIYLIGDFSGWQESKEFSFIKLPGGNWELDVSYDVLKHEDLYKLSIHWPGGKGERIPAWASRVVQDPGSLIFNAQVWNPKEPYQWKIEYFRRDDIPPLIYEAHVGMATEDWGVGSYIEFREKVLPRIKKAGYNTIQLMAIQEHPYYGSFGYHVSSFFAPSSRFGTPDELKSLV
ncbi:MAG: 1,4-alpha-glucan-branching enzyme, partial [Bacteroidota bacterium]